jgi:hypothetical protein
MPNNSVAMMLERREGNVPITGEHPNSSPYPKPVNDETIY